MMAAMFSGILTFLSNSIVRLLAEKVLIWVAIKALLVSLFVVVLPIVLNNFFGGLMEETLQKLSTMNITGGLSGANFSGFLGWLLECFNIPQICAIMVSAIQMRITVAILPFSPFK